MVRKELLTYKVYGNLMRITKQDEAPAQPHFNHRLTLERAPPREYLPQTPMRGNGFKFELSQLPLTEACPRKTVKDINLTNLQVWLTHLGEALWNPIDATLLNGTYHFSDGDHRTRCLWELGVETVALNLKTLAHKDVDWRLPYIKWYRNEATQNMKPRRKTSVKYNLYPDIQPPTSALQSFLGSRHDYEGRFKEYLDVDVSFRKIIDPERINIFDHIAQHLRLKGASILDVGCSFGFYSYLCAEADAASVYAVDVVPLKTQVVQDIVRRRKMFKGHIRTCCMFIDRFLKVTNGAYDATLLLNVFHHLLKQNPTQAWETFNMLLERSKAIYLMTGNVWNVFGDYEGNIVNAVKANCKREVNLEPIYHSSYRNRTVYEVTST